MNGSLDFLNMIKTQSKAAVRGSGKPQEAPKYKIKPGGSLCAVIDTETNWHNEVMSLGVALADSESFRCVERRYYIFEPEASVGGIYAGVLNKCDIRPIRCDRSKGMSDLADYLADNRISQILAYNAGFDCGHLPELSKFKWYDIMRLAAYKQYNSVIPDELPCCKSGRLKTGYGVEPIMRMLTGNTRYMETHNAVNDAVDELKIVELLGHPLVTYECARI